MKKMIFMLVTAAIMCFALAACGGGGESDKAEEVVYAGWFSAEFPEDFEAIDEKENDFRRDLGDGYSEDRICVYVDDDPNFVNSQEWYVTNYGYTKSEAEIGDYNWNIYTDGTNIRAFAVIEEFDDGNITGMEVFIDMCDDANDTLENEEVKSFMESLTVVADDPYEAYREFLGL